MGLRLHLMVSALAAFGLACGSDSAEPSPIPQDAVDAADSSDAGDGPSADDDTGAAAASWDPLSPGEFNVGYTVDSVTFEPPDGSGPRTLRLAWWYPTRDRSGSAASYLQIFTREGVWENAAVAAERAPFPLVLFSHGNGVFAEQSGFLTEYLASHGFVVAAPDHTGNTLSDTGGIKPEIYYLRPWDMSAVLDHAASLPNDHLLTNAIDPSAVAITGHSFGGYTTLAVAGARWDVDSLLAACDNAGPGVCDALGELETWYRSDFRDDRVRAAIPMTPGATRVFGPRVAEIAVPTLLMTAGMDQTTTNLVDGDPTWSALSTGSGHVRVDFATAGHFTFSDACELPFGIGADDGCGPDNIPYADAHRAINAYVLAFLRRHLVGDDPGAALLEGDESIEDDASVSVSAP